MSQSAQLDRKAIERFNHCWEALFQVVPEARAQEVEAMGQAAQQELNAQIGAADLEDDAKVSVRSWQELRLGSKGGYAALSAKKASPFHPGKKPKSWKGKSVTVKQITKWLERGHGIRKANTTKAYAWSKTKNSRAQSSGVSYVKGRMFYSWTKTKAMGLALKAADQVLSKIADEVDY